MFRFETKDIGDLKAIEVSDGLGTWARFIPERGGILAGLNLSGIPVFYMDDDTLHDFSKNIRGGNPVLFPVCGPLEGERYTVDNIVYSMKQHGFARNLPWQVDEIQSFTDSAKVVLKLKAGTETKRVYPFWFELEFTYEIYPDAVRIKQRYLNISSRDMPFYGGFHPYFLLPGLEIKDIYIPSDSYYDIKTGTSHFFDGSIDLNHSEETNLVFTDLSDSNAWIKRKDSTKITVRFDDNFRYLVLWALRGKEFLCMEPWMGNNYDLNRGKALVLGPGEQFEAKVSYSVE